MFDKNCNNYLTSIALAIIISTFFTLLFFNGIITGITNAFIFSLILTLLSLLILAIFGTSDNGVTRNSLCHNCLGLIVSIIGNIFTSLLALLIPLSSGSTISAIVVAVAFFFFVSNLFLLLNLLTSILRFT